MILLVLFSIFYVVTAQSRPPTLRIVTSDLNGALLDPKTGIMSCITPLPLPGIPTDCTWNLVKGTRGQSSTVFHMNQTNFITLQSICPTGVTQTTVFQLSGPYYCTNPSGMGTVNLHTLYRVDPTVPVMELNMAWDHTCNVVVIQPKTTDTEIAFTTKQVSEYDTEVRPQVDYTDESIGCDTCWKKVNGLGEVDFGNWEASWPLGAELNCGEYCAFYSLEEQYVNGQVVPPRAIIGRSFRTGKLLADITDSMQAQTLSWNPLPRSQNQFLGIGICCEESWCHSYCHGIDQHMVIFSLTTTFGQTPTITLLADIGSVIDPDTSRIGIEYSSGYFYGTNPMYIYIWYQGSVITYQIIHSNGYIVSLAKIGQSPKITSTIITWAPLNL
jgi:hypothetical protein